MLRNLIKYALKSANRTDSLPYPTMQVKYMGKISDAFNLTPYGVYYNLPLNSYCAVFNSVGQAQNLFAIGNTPTKRCKDLEPGELVIGSPISKSNDKYELNGDINKTVNGDYNNRTTQAILLQAGTTITLDAGGAITIDAVGAVTVDASSVTINANVVINGTLAVTGDVTAFSGGGGEITFSDIVTKYNAHQHVETGGTTNTPTNSLP